jgi:hypothetical protein
MAKKSSTVKKAIRKPAEKNNSQRSNIKKQNTVEQVRQLAWTGQHAAAIDSATGALSASGKGGRPSAPTVTMSLLDLRAESYIAIGKLDLAMKDAKAMGKLVISLARSPRLQAPYVLRTWLRLYQLL